MANLKARKFAIRTDATDKIGSGHVMRCLTLACELQQRGADVHFISHPVQSGMRKRIMDKGFTLHDLASKNPEQTKIVDHATPHEHWLATSWRDDAAQTNAILQQIGDIDWLIVDHYGLDHRWESKMRRSAGAIMVIDDLCDRRHDCDLLLDQVYGHTADDYAGLVPEQAQILSGVKYVMLRPEFARWRPTSLARRKTIRALSRILVCVGGNDNTEIVLDILRQLCSGKLPMKVDIVPGVAKLSGESINRACNNDNIEVRVHEFDANMAELMSNADLAIMSAGGTTWERMSVGLPGIAIIIAEHQRKIAYMLEAAGLQIVAENCEQNNEHDVLTALTKMMDIDYYLKMSGRCANIIDGLGVKRVADKLVREN